MLGDCTAYWDDEIHQSEFCGKITAVACKRETLLVLKASSNHLYVIRDPISASWKELMWRDWMNESTSLFNHVSRSLNWNVTKLKLKLKIQLNNISPYFDGKKEEKKYPFDEIKDNFTISITRHSFAVPSLDSVSTFYLFWCWKSWDNLTSHFTLIKVKSNLHINASYESFHYSNTLSAYIHQHQPHHINEWREENLPFNNRWSLNELNDEDIHNNTTHPHHVNI